MTLSIYTLYIGVRVIWDTRVVIRSDYKISIYSNYNSNLTNKLSNSLTKLFS
jgi:hypothetical protein